ncbi:hypothetical protein N7491_010258 [Penicillium cf. griseofulvum]|uniref:Uncharacterized protein n=1 Tax=Penicillium cf. griseofulvum TaxID=2972120 RepID=A0A9W9T5R1_9EURO|nr:hypothetical protein N7472_000591 [Penicillium cf. griseofulvum]KAJ5421813.1 hypothetical protein N7491_010258 [Penicillium cf. griseofulvum]KAJ5428004.1 hypothetical protein N7445_009458 [Penicillium cf. griseofulvum]
MMQPGPRLPEWEMSDYECVYFVTVRFDERHRTYSSEKLMQSMIRRIKDGKAEVSLKPLHHLTLRCISMPVYGPYDAPTAVILASARVVAETRLNEIHQGFVEIDMDLVFGRQN